ALSRSPQFVVIGLETPDGTTVLETQVPPESFRRGINTNSFRINLPLVIDGQEHWEGEWQLLLGLRIQQEPIAVARSSVASVQTRSFAQFPRATSLPYHALVHARSNLRMHGSIDQSGFTPGSQFFLRALITEYGSPIETHPQVTVLMTRPDQTTSYLSLVETAPGEFEVAVTVNQVGVYRFLLQAVGQSTRGQHFSREQLLTSVIGRVTPAFGGQSTDGDGKGDDTLCELLECLTKRNVLTDRFIRRLEELGIDVSQLRRCVTDKCRPSINNPTDDSMDNSMCKK
ncbi:MAG: hypothetical protein AAFU03_12855, partial [Bacteroidota bacterium]